MSSFMEAKMYQITNDPYLLMVLKREKEDTIEGLRKEKIAREYARSINPKYNKLNILAWIRKNLARLVTERDETVSMQPDSSPTLNQQSNPGGLLS
jgi:hypothetical protein